MDNAKNGRWIISFKEFDRIRVNHVQVLIESLKKLLKPIKYKVETSAEDVL